MNGCNMTVHRDYANKSCPGEWLYSRHGKIAAEVNKRLGANDTNVGSTVTVTPPSSSDECPCRKKKPLRTRTKFVIAAMVNITWYTVAVLFLSWHDHTVPSELTVAWFAAWTAELAILAGITIKSKSSGDDNGDDNSADG